MRAKTLQPPSAAAIRAADGAVSTGVSEQVKGKGGKIRSITVTDRSVLERLDRSRRYPLLTGPARNWTLAIEKLVHEVCGELYIKLLGRHAFRAAAAQLTCDRPRAQGCNDRAAC